MSKKITQFIIEKKVLKGLFILSAFLVSCLSYAQDAEPATNLSVDNSTPNVFILSWDAPANATGYNIYLNDITNGVDVGYVGSIGAVTSYTFSGTVTTNGGSNSAVMTDGNIYTFTVQSTPDSALPWGDNYVSYTVNAPVDPEAPTGVSVTQATANEFTLSWDDDPNATGGFNIFITPDGGSFTYLTTLAAGSTSYLFTGSPGGVAIADGNIYSVSVQALPDGDSSAYAHSGSFTLGSLSSDAELRKSNFKVYPNPVLNELSIRSQGVSNNLKAQIYSVTGKLIKEFSSDSVSVSDLRSGLYLLAVESDNGEKTIKKFVKI